MIIGVDLGNYSVKTSERISFLSKVSETEKFTNDDEVIYEGKRIYVGQGEFETDYNKARKENTLPLLYTSLAKSSEEDYFQIVLGLPIQQYKSHKEELKGYINNNKIKSLIVEGIERDIVITDIEVCPEGASAYYNLPKEVIVNIGTKPLIILDIGSRTTDICLFIFVNGKRKIETIKTLPIGMLNIYKDIVDKVNTEYTQGYKLEDGEDILINGLFLYGENKDISFIKPIVKRHFDSLYKELQIEFDISKGYILLTGGGSLLLKQPFINRIPNLILSKDPIYDNALGFRKVGESLYG